MEPTNANKKFLVTGGSGFIGSNFIRILLANNCEVINFDALKYSGLGNNLREFHGDRNYHFVKGDITNYTDFFDVLKKYRPQYVVNFAAETHVDRSISGPAEFIQTNISGTYNVLEAVTKFRDELKVSEEIRLVHISTDEVFGSAPKGVVFSESSSYAPNSPYAASKAASDHLARAWHKTFGTPVIITNCSNNYGPYQYPEKLIPVIITKVLKEENIPVYGDGTNVRDWIYVDDHARAVLEVAYNGRLGQTYLIGASNELTNNEIVNLVCDILDKKLLKQTSCRDLIINVEDRKGHDFRYAIDSSKISNELKWSPKTSFQEGMEKTIDWYLANESWWQPLLGK